MANIFEVIEYPNEMMGEIVAPVPRSRCGRFPHWIAGDRS